MTVSQEQVQSDRSDDAAPADDVADRGRRPVSVWDISGLLLLVSAMLAITALVPQISEDWLRQSAIVDWLAGLAGVAFAGSLGVAIAMTRPAALSIPARLIGVWLHPPGDWPAFVLGFALAAPLLGLYWPTLFTDSDSMRLVAAVRHVQRGNLDFLVETQDSFGPHLFLGAPAVLGSPEGLRVVTILSMMALAGVLAWVGRRLSGSMTAAAATALALLSIPSAVEQVLYLPMYTAMLAFACTGSWLAYRAIAQDAGWRYAWGAGICLVMAQETQLVGQLFLSVPLMLLATAPSIRRGVANVARVYACVVAFLVPRILVNLSHGGLSHWRTNRTDYWIIQGYLRDIQADLLDYAGLEDSYTTYLQQFPGRLLTSLGDFGWVALALAAAALLGLRGRAWWGVLGFATVVVAAMTTRTIQPTPRYFSPFWPGMALLAGLTVAWLLRRRHIVWRVLGVSALVLLACLVPLSLRASTREGTTLADRVDTYRDMVAVIDDGKGVIGARALPLVAADIDTRTFGGQFLTENDYVTYLTWPSDEAVLEVLERYDTGWVVVRKMQSLEVDYHNTWLVPHHGLQARHPDMVASSPNFCTAFTGAGVTLYKLDPSGQDPCEGASDGPDR